TRNEGLTGEELETMKKLHVRFANNDYARFLSYNKNYVTLESLAQDDLLGFRSGLIEIMNCISSRIAAHFQIEFVFNIVQNERHQAMGQFHVVQLTQLPEIKFEPIELPTQVEHCYLAISNLQGHGIKSNIKYAVVVSPFLYSRNQHDRVRQRLFAINQMMKKQNENYVIIAPGRLGSKNRDWGIQIDYRDVDRAVGLFEYGVDIAGRPEPLPESDDNTGGIYGSHFLYMLQGGYDEQQKRRQTRMYGTQGTHFLTNLVSNNIIYGFIAPIQDRFDPTLFKVSDPDDVVQLFHFPVPATLYADSINQRCMLVT
ncbi:MAG: hypothetical protein ONB16_09410, partial [candidate division KSB1 bacterium]|nr:hypothetical protein [candidate division KSB1 bacterium]